MSLSTIVPQTLPLQGSQEKVAMRQAVAEEVRARRASRDGGRYMVVMEWTLLQSCV